MTPDQVTGLAARAFLLGAIGGIWGWARTKKQFWKQLLPSQVVETDYLFGFVVWLCLGALIGLAALLSDWLTSDFIGNHNCVRFPTGNVSSNSGPL